MRLTDRAVLALFAIAQFVVAMLLMHHSAPIALLFFALALLALQAAARSPRPPRQAKTRAKTR